MYLTDVDNYKNPSYRDYQAWAILGAKRQGKSQLAKRMIDEFIKKYPSAKVLVYDISSAFGEGKGFKGYPLISQDFLNKFSQKGDSLWKQGVRRITNISPDDFLKFIVSKRADGSFVFQNGLIVIDEATTIFGDNPQDHHRAIFTTHTNQKVDIYCIFHQLARVPKRLRPEFWNYVLFNTNEAISTNDQQQGVRALDSMGFPFAEKMWLGWSAVQNPPKDDRIIQRFSVVSADKLHIPKP